MPGHSAAAFKKGWGKFAEAILVDRQAPAGVPSNLVRVARRKFVQVNSAAVLGDLAAHRATGLETLSGNLAGSHSIRINDQWRVVFRWTDAGPEDVEIMDYHK